MNFDQNFQNRLLIVDDEKLARHLIQKYFGLQCPDIELDSAVDGKEAKEKILKWQPQVVLSDINMPEMDGLTLLSEVKKILPQTKFVLITARDDNDSPIQALKFGAFDYLRKPLNMDEVVHVIRKAFGEWELQKNLEKKEEALKGKIDELKNSEKSLNIALLKAIETSKLQTRFISVISHEFRTPLTSIKSSAEMLECFSIESDKYQKYISFILSGVDRLSKLVDDILYLHKIQDETQEFKPFPLNINSFCNRILDEVRLCFPGRTLNFFSSLDLNKKILLDEDLMFKALSNLLVNSLKYSSNDTPVNFSLSIETFQPDFLKSQNCGDDSCCFGELEDRFKSLATCKFLKLFIQDQGIGIPQKEIKKIFEPYFRGSNVGSIKGTGLGMVIVKKAVERHGGFIHLTSFLQKGSEFSIFIPYE